MGGSSAVSNVIVSCVKCCKLRGPLVEQKMSDLPEDRVETSPNFSYCAVDYFGPFMIKERRKKLKELRPFYMYVFKRGTFRNCIFLRKGVRLSTHYGVSCAAGRELQEALEEMNHEHIRNQLLKRECGCINFKMNKPGSSHMVGVWERQIRSVSAILSSLLSSNPTRLDDESLRTFMCEAETIINSRPLTVDQLTDPDSPAPRELPTG